MGRFTQVPSLDAKLEKQISGLTESFPMIPGVLGVLLTGSCSRGEATFRSDIDLLVILDGGELKFDRVREVRDQIEKELEKAGKGELLQSPLPVEITVVLPSVFSTEEPAMKAALKLAMILSDPTGELRKKVA